MSYKISKRADSDIDQIWDYIAADNPEAADRFERDLREFVPYHRATTRCRS